MDTGRKGDCAAISFSFGAEYDKIEKEAYDKALAPMEPWSIEKNHCEIGCVMDDGGR